MSEAVPPDAPAPRPQPAAPKKLSPAQIRRNRIIAVVLLLLVFGPLFGGFYACAPRQGQVCKDSAWGCYFGYECVSEGRTERCRKSCNADADCGKGMSCRRLMVIGGNGDYRACY